MKIKLLIIFLIPLISGFVSSTIPDWSDDPMAAFQSSLLEARHHSDKNDRPYMIIFQADWCSPCQWMDKFTLSDTRVQESLLHNYSAVKMDIDEFEGFALKEQYQVKLLPTILFFDRNNDIIGRYENTYDVDDFLKILDAHKRFGTQQLLMAKSTSSPATMSAHKTSTPMRRPVHTISTNGAASNTASTATTHTTATLPTRRTVQTSTPSPSTSSHVSTSSSPEFTIQVGAFNSYQNADRMIHKMKSTNTADHSVRIRQLDHIKYPYRVTVGEYYSHEEAAAALMQLDNQGVNGLLKRVNQFQSH